MYEFSDYKHKVEINVMGCLIIHNYFTYTNNKFLGVNGATRLSFLVFCFFGFLCACMNSNSILLGHSKWSISTIYLC